MRRVAASALVALAVAACGGGEGARDDARGRRATPGGDATPGGRSTTGSGATTGGRAATSGATPFASASPTPPPAAPSREVTFSATDGEPVSALFTPAGRRAPAVLLLHEIHGRPEQWEDFVPYLHSAGFATLAYESRGTPVEKDRLPDALGALRWLRGRDDVDARRIALVGASIGASTTVLAMATGARRTADAAVALSPPDTPDVADLQDAGRYRPHDVLFVSDESESAPVDGMLRGAVRSRAIRSQGAGHGVRLLKEDGVRDALLGWLDDRVKRR